jgi:hydrogenase maturation factor
VVEADVVRRIRLDDVGAEFDRLADQRNNSCQIAVHHVAARLGIRLENQRLDHQRHPVVIAFGFQPQDVLDALVGDLGLAGDAEQIDDDAARIQPDRLKDRLLDHT